MYAFIFLSNPFQCIVSLGDRTAVRLHGDHRMHDYINANEIKVIAR